MGKYTGDKWGGKYLRAPDIYWKILEKAGDKLVRLGDIAEVRFGIKTGCNEFFYLPSKHFDIALEGDYYRLIPKHEGVPDDLRIETEFLEIPLLQKTKEILKPDVMGADLTHKVLTCHVPEAQVGHYQIRRYIDWAEEEDRKWHERPTCAQRASSGDWYALAPPPFPNIVVPIGHKRRPVVGMPVGALADANFNEVRLQDHSDKELIAASIFSTFTLLLYEIHGRANFGQGLLKTQTYEINDLLVLNPEAITSARQDRVLRAMRRISQRNSLMIYDDVRNPDRTALDDAFLMAVGFEGAQVQEQVMTELHDATCRMIWHRMAKTGNSREARRSYDEWVATGEPFGLDLAEEANEDE